MTPAQVLQFERRAGRGGPPGDYGRFTGELSADELAACFFFDTADRQLIARRRGERGRLGFAVQLGTVRYLGRFLEDPAAVPAGVVRFTAREIGVPADTDLSDYGRGRWRWAHQEEIPATSAARLALGLPARERRRLTLRRPAQPLDPRLEPLHPLYEALVLCPQALRLAPELGVLDAQPAGLGPPDPSPKLRPVAG